MKFLISLTIRLWSHITRQRKLQFAMLVILMVISAFAEVVSLGSLLPFLGALTAPETVFNHPYAAFLIQSLQLKSPEELILPLAVIFSIAALLAGLIRLLLAWLSIYVSNSCGADLSIKVYETTLFQPYHVHVSRNSSEVIAAIQKVGSAQIVVGNCLQIISSTLLISFIMSALLVINTKVAIIAAIFYLICYSLIALRVRSEVESNSEVEALKQTHMIKALQEGLGGIREVILDSTQLFYSDIFRRAQIPAMRARSKNAFITAAPRHIMEALSLCLIAALAYSLSRDQGTITAALPILGALALGAQRMLPAIQLLYASWSGITGSSFQLADVLELLDQPLSEYPGNAITTPLTFEKEICFDDVHFRYSDDTPWVLSGINIKIPKAARVAFVGITGSGKSTILDLLMGLLQPTIGKISVDGVVIDKKSTNAWRQKIAHVPQSIYLTDTTIAENIAFGVQKKDIDIERVKQATLLAQIDGFIETRQHKYDTVIGEHGIRLSGGQRQRIGIARALYKTADVLILDEATSALDNATETALVDAIESLENDLTSIIVAHRITTVVGCDIIIEIKDGRVADYGNYEELLKKSENFRNMVKTRSDSNSNST